MTDEEDRRRRSRCVHLLGRGLLRLRRRRRSGDWRRCRGRGRRRVVFVIGLVGDVAYGTLEACKEGIAIVCERSTGAPGASMLPSSCIDALNTGCGDLEPSSTCVGQKGTLAEGTPCEFDGPCASGRCGSGGSTPGCGVCKAASDASTSRTPAGGGCDNEGACERGLSCLDASPSGIDPTRGTCGPTRALGESCLDAEDCNTGFYGDFGWMGFTVACLDGGCAKPLDEGATCSGDNRCVGDGGSGTCVPKAPAGGLCTVDYDCRFGLSCVAGSCAVLPADRCK